MFEEDQTIPLDEIESTLFSLQKLINPQNKTQNSQINTQKQSINNQIEYEKENQQINGNMQNLMMQNLQSLASEIKGLSTYTQDQKYSKTPEITQKQRNVQISKNQATVQQNSTQSKDLSDKFVERMKEANYRSKERQQMKQTNRYYVEQEQMKQEKVFLKTFQKQFIFQFTNRQSEKIMTNKPQQPIYLRQNQVIREKQAKLDNLKSHFIQEQMEKSPQPTFKPQLYTQNYPQYNRNFDEVISDLQSWQQRKNLNSQKAFLEEHMKIQENHTFTPNINKKSKKILQERSLNVPFDQRQQRLQEKSNLRQKQNQCDKLSFTPVINKKSKQMIEKIGRVPISQQLQGQNKQNQKTIDNRSRSISAHLPKNRYESARSKTPDSIKILEKYKNRTKIRSVHQKEIQNVQMTENIDNLYENQDQICDKDFLSKNSRQSINEIEFKPEMNFIMQNLQQKYL